MMKKMMTALCVTALAGLVLGCAPTRLEMDYGVSHNLQKFNQTLNPQAEQNLSPVEGLNGKAAQNAVEKYQKGFEKSTEGSSGYQFGVGSIGTSK